MKKRRVVICIAAALILLCSCSETVEKTDRNNWTKNPEKLTIAFSIPGYSAPYFRAMIDYAMLEAVNNGMELVSMEADWDTKVQEEDIDYLIEQKVDAVCVVPVDSLAVVDVYQRVKQAGIPLIDVNVQNDDLSQNVIDCFVGASMEEESYLAAESMMKLLGESGGNIVMLEGAEGNFATVHRTKGFEDAIAQNINYKIIARAYTGWEREIAKQKTKGFLEQYPEIDALFAHDDNIAIGAIEAIKEAGRAGEFPIISISGNTDGYEAIKNGEIYSTVSQPPDWEGITAVRTAIRLINGEEVPKWIKTPVKLVTRENVSEFRGIW